MTVWLNGAGSTSEIVRAGGDDFLWRISVATVEGASEFSRYPGVDRMLAPLSPEGLDLEVAGERIRLVQGSVLGFAGEDAARSLGTAVTEDLNLMVRRGAASGSLSIVAIEPTTFSAGAGAVVVMLLEGTLECDGRPLRRRDAVLLETTDSVEVRGEGTLAVATLGPPTVHAG